MDPIDDGLVLVGGGLGEVGGGEEEDGEAVVAGEICGELEGVENSRGDLSAVELRLELEGVVDVSADADEQVIWAEEAHRGLAGESEIGIGLEGLMAEGFAGLEVGDDDFDAGGLGVDGEEEGKGGGRGEAGAVWWRDMARFFSP